MTIQCASAPRGASLMPTPPRARVGIPNTFEEAIEIDKEDNNNNWRIAIENELNNIKENNVGKICRLPPNKRKLPAKYIFKVKRDEKGIIKKYKARYVVKGFHQKEGYDYTHTFAPVAVMTTTRTVINLAAAFNWYIMQIDITSAFLQGDIDADCDIYIDIPKGMCDDISQKQLAFKLNKSLYGLKQAPRLWHLTLKRKLLTIGFYSTSVDPCLFKRKNIYIENNIYWFLGQPKKKYKKIH